MKTNKHLLKTKINIEYIVHNKEKKDKGTGA
jgi:hypothetical protein